MLYLLVSSSVMLAPPKTEPKPPETLLPPEATAILKEYAADVAEINKRHAKRVQPLQDKLNSELKAKAKVATDRLRKLQDTATKAGRLEEAVAIKGAIASMSGGVGLAAEGQAPSDSSEFRGHKYRFMNETLTWHKAKARCEELGGHLATIEDAAELAFCASLANGRYAYLGGTDENQEGRWEWVTGEPWTQGTHGFDNGKDMEHWLLINAEGKWNDGTSGHRMGYICEWE